MPLFLIYPISLASVGFEYSTECNIDKKIPVWFMIYGLIGILMVLILIFLIEYLILIKRIERSKLFLTIVLVSLALIAFIELILFFVGSVWIFRANSKVTFEKTDDSIQTYCQPVMFKFGLATLCIQCIIFGIFLILSPCLKCLPLNDLMEEI